MAVTPLAAPIPTIFWSLSLWSPYSLGFGAYQACLGRPAITPIPDHHLIDNDKTEIPASYDKAPCIAPQTIRLWQDLL
jgi:hypothetical protein